MYIMHYLNCDLHTACDGSCFILKVINKEFEEKGAHSGPYQLIRFEENAISLDVSKFNSEMNGWELTPQSPPIVS